MESLNIKDFIDLGSAAAVVITVVYFLGHLKRKDDKFIDYLGKKDDDLVKITENHINHNTTVLEKLTSSIDRLNDKLDK